MIAVHLFSVLFLQVSESASSESACYEIFCLVDSFFLFRYISYPHTLSLIL
jgi:hypothetical protein